MFKCSSPWSFNVGLVFKLAYDVSLCIAQYAYQLLQDSLEICDDIRLCLEDVA